MASPLFGPDRKHFLVRVDVSSVDRGHASANCIDEGLLAFSKPMVTFRDPSIDLVHVNGSDAVGAIMMQIFAHVCSITGKAAGEEPTFTAP